MKSKLLLVPVACMLSVMPLVSKALTQSQESYCPTFVPLCSSLYFLKTDEEKMAQIKKFRSMSNPLWNQSRAMLISTVHDCMKIGIAVKWYQGIDNQCINGLPTSLP